MKIELDLRGMTDDVGLGVTPKQLLDAMGLDQPSPRKEEWIELVQECLRKGSDLRRLREPLLNLLTHYTKRIE